MKVAIYVRVSTSDQAEHGYSIEEQTDRLEKYCDALGFNIVKSYVDAGFSGSNMNRPALQEMIADAKRGNFAKVIVYKLDRLSRSQKDTLFIIEDVFIRNNVDFLSMSENFDTSTPLGKAMIGILSVFAQLEREQIKERMEMGRIARAKTGKHYGGCYSPIGYSYTNGKLIVNEYEKMLVQRIFREFLSGSNSNQIANSLNADGLTARGTDWSVTVVQKLLRKRTYIGFVQFKGEYYRGEHEPIISEDDFNAAQEILDIRKKNHGENRRDGMANSYLAGMLVCGKCGSKMAKIKYGHGNSIVPHYCCYSRSKRNKKLVYDPNCKNKAWRMDDLDELVFNEIRKLSLETHQKAEKTDNRETIRSEINKIDKRIKAEMDMFSVDGIPIDLLQSRIADLDRKKKKLEAELKRAEQDNAKVLDAADMIRSFDELLKHASFPEIRMVLSALIEKIVVNDEDVTIHWRLF